MKGATCHFCSRSFRNGQGVRAHLKSCAAYRQRPKAVLPSVGSTPGTPGARDTYPALDATWEPIPDATPPRSHAPRIAAGTGQKTSPVGGLARWMIQSVKDEVLGKGALPRHAIPSETKTQALIAIERELSRLPVDQLPRAELVTVAEGIRDRFYRPVMQAQQRAREQAERTQNQARQRTVLIAAGSAHASRVLRQQPNLDWLVRLDLEQKVTRALEQDLDGSESEADVQAQVTKTIERELKPLQKQTREKVRQQLIAHGVAYAKGELDWKDLAAWERSQIEHAVKQALQQEITGDESKEEVGRRVDEILREILPETDAEDDEDEWDEGEDEDDEDEDEED
jgi:hypothetical protein